MPILTILFLHAISRAAKAQTRPYNITLGSSLTPTSNSTWPSPSGVYAFGFFPQHVNSYAVGIFLPDKTVVWTANRNISPTVPNDVVSMILSPEGRLILRRRQGRDVGRGASGTVFKGVMQNGQKMVAVKRLEKEFAQGEIEFQTKLKTIGKMYHRNLVRVLGYCLDGDNKLLVFEFMSNGSLANILFNQEKRPNWEERMDIARDISRGILYLHQECETQIIHCDIKPQNILMDGN